MKETSVTLISTNLNMSLKRLYPDYHIILDNFNYADLLEMKKVIFYNILNDLSKEEIVKLINYMKDNNIKFIIFTNNLELCLYTDYLVVCDQEKILAEGRTMDILENDKLLKRLGFELPFYVDLSLLLKDYGLVDKIYLSKEGLKEALWK